MDTNPYAPPKAAVGDVQLIGASLYFWRIKDLKRRLATDPLSDREALPYFVACNGLTALVMLVPPIEYNKWDWAGCVISLAFAILGPIWMFKQNGGSAGTQFLQRALALGWVMLLRIMALALPALLLLYIIVAATVGENPGTDWYDLAAIVALQLALYARVGAHIRDVALGAPPQLKRGTQG